MLTASLVQSHSPGMVKEAEGLHLSGVEMSPRALWGHGWAVVYRDRTPSELSATCDGESFSFGEGAALLSSYCPWGINVGAWPSQPPWGCWVE